MEILSTNVVPFLILVPAGVGAGMVRGSLQGMNKSVFFEARMQESLAF